MSLEQVLNIFHRQKRGASYRLMVEDVPIDVTHKRIRNITMRVYAPDGRVRISAPFFLEPDMVRQYAASKVPWIREQQERLRNQIRQTPRVGLEHGVLSFLGKQYPIILIECSGVPAVALKEGAIVLSVRKSTNRAEKEKLLDRWYREQLKEFLVPYIPRWENRMQVHIKELGIKRMKTRWGSCNPRAARIWLSLELAKKSPHCIEYVLVHELAHLLEASHNRRFKSLMDTYLPEWRNYKEELRR